jgi:hypothetical protein
MGAIFRCDAPAMLENTLFRYVLAMFLLSWAVALALIASPGRLGFMALGLLYPIAYVLTFYGLLTVPMIGALLIASLPLAALSRQLGR